MAIYTFFDIGTGEIGSIWTSTPPPHTLPTNVIQLSEDNDADSFDSQLHYIVAGELVDRPIQLTTVDTTTVIGDDIDATTFTNLPDPCEVQVSGEGAYAGATVIGGEESFTFDTSGSYQVSINAFPYQKLEVTINVT